MIIKKYPAKKVSEGAGVIVNRVFGYGNTKEFDPFLMLDYFNEKANKTSKGFPWHPHKGIETISYFLRGSGLHEDSLGNKVTIKAGELQWMSAGKGIMHQEMPDTTKNGVEGFQFWVNMPAKFKLNNPTYDFIKKDEMKSYTTDGTKVNVIAGIFKGIKGPINKEEQGITMLHIILAKTQEISLSRTKNKQGFIYVFKGKGSLNNENIHIGNAYTLSEGMITIKSNKYLEFIYAEGTPLNEPIAWYGPIVMNTNEEIKETLQAINDGTFV
jgi:redox-sensitive bicupin YhaK (pirin superfamily)